MADNVLGVLFQDIADAIRAKTGGTDTMKPAEFPAQISSIVTGGIVGGDTLKFKDGTFHGNAGTQIITHDFGSVPDMLMIYVCEANDEPWTLQFVQGFSSAMLASGIETACLLYFNTTGGSVGIGASDGNGMELDLDGTNYKKYGGVHSVNTSTFTVGMPRVEQDDGVTGAAFPNGKVIRWVALGGIVG